MMRVQFRLIAAVLLLAALSSCQREVDAVLPPSTATNGGTGNPGGGSGGSGGTGTSSDSSYMPLVAGNWWKFRDSTSGNFQTMTVTTRTLPYNGRSFSALYLQPSGNGVDTSFYTHDATDYRFLALAGMPNIRLEYLYLRDTTVGTTWSTNAGSVNGLSASADGEVLETNISKTVRNVTYQKVIHSLLEVSYAGLGVVATYHFYSAKGVGIIAIYSDLGMPGMPGQRIVQELESYHLN